MANRAQGSEHRPATPGEEVAQRSLVNMSLSSQVPARPAAEDSRPIDHGEVDRPIGQRPHQTASGGAWPIRQTQWKARCYAFRAFRPAGIVPFGGPLLGAPDRQVPTSAAAAGCSPQPGVHRRPGARAPRHRLRYHQVALRVAHLCARTRSPSRCMRRLAFAPAVAPPCAVAPTPLRYWPCLSASWPTRRPARQGRFNHVLGRLQTSHNVP